MDPNAALTRIRECADSLGEWHDADEWEVGVEAVEAMAHDVGDIVENFRGLDEWLSRDGFLPSDWAAEEDKVSTPRTGDMTMGEALNYAIFAINTFMHPDASEPSDVDALEAHSDDVIEALVELRNIYRATTAH
jgi:hypothetical protein